MVDSLIIKNIKTTNLDVKKSADLFCKIILVDYNGEKNTIFKEKQ